MRGRPRFAAALALGAVALGVQASTTAGPSPVTLRVAGPGIPTELVVGLGSPDADGLVSGRTVAVPTGGDRRFIVSYFTGPTETHADTIVRDLRGSTDSLAFVLRRPAPSAVAGPGLRAVALAAAPAPFVSGADTVLVAAGRTVTLEARVEEEVVGGPAPVTGPLADAVVTWASLDPALATLTTTACTTDALGGCTAGVFVADGLSAGTTVDIAVIAEGRAAVVVLEVEAPG